MVQKLTQLNFEVVYFYYEMGEQRKKYLGYRIAPSVLFHFIFSFKIRMKYIFSLSINQI